MYFVLIPLVLFTCVFAQRYREISTKEHCVKVGKYCELQCRYGGAFQRDRCIKECKGNTITCGYLTHCFITSEDARLLQYNKTIGVGEPCFHDYAFEYFCNHVFYPCTIECLEKGKADNCETICTKRKSFCECGLDYYLQPAPTEEPTEAPIEAPTEAPTAEHPHAFKGRSSSNSGFNGRDTPKRGGLFSNNRKDYVAQYAKKPSPSRKH